MGLDNSAAFFHEGYRSHPCVWPDNGGYNQYFRQKAENYNRFYDYVSGYYHRLEKEEQGRRGGRDGVLRMTIVQRAVSTSRGQEDEKTLPDGAPANNRLLLNLDGLLKEGAPTLAASAPTCWCWKRHPSRSSAGCSGRRQTCSCQ